MAEMTIDQYAALPIAAEQTWQWYLDRVPVMLRNEQGKVYQPWLATWASATDVKGWPAVIDEQGLSPADMAVKSLLWAVASGGMGNVRPAYIEVTDPQVADGLRQQLGVAVVEVRVVDAVANAKTVAAFTSMGLRRHPPMPSLFEVEGVTNDHLLRLADAGAQLANATLNDWLGPSDLLQIESPEAPHGMSIARLSPQTLGLALYENVGAFRRTMHEKVIGILAADPGCVWFLDLVPIQLLPIEDAEAWERNQLAPPDLDAYPCPWSSTGQQAIRPTVEQVVFMEGLLRALAAAEEHEIDSGRFTKTVQTQAGQVEYAISLPDLLNPPSTKELMDRGWTMPAQALEQPQAILQRYLDAHPPKGQADVQRIIQEKFMGRAVDPSMAPPRNPAEEAQDLCYQAHESLGRRRVILARRALELDPGCADAHYILAGHATDDEQRMELFRKAMELSAASLAEAKDPAAKGEAWRFLPARTHLRSKHRVALLLDEQGNASEASRHYRELLQLDREDHLGVRYDLLAMALVQRRDQEAWGVIMTYPERSFAYAFSRALLAYRASGDKEPAREAIDEAIALNRHLPEMLSKRRFDDEDVLDSRPGQRGEVEHWINEVGGLDAIPADFRLWAIQRAQAAPVAKAAKKKDKGRHKR